MIIQNPSIISDKIIFLGKPASIVYLVKGHDEYTLIGGGTIDIVFDLEDQLKKFSIEKEKIKRIVILHSHFDHCGIVPYLKKKWPWIKITASERAKQIFKDVSAVAAMKFLNDILLAQYDLTEKAKQIGLEFNEIDVEETVKDKDVINCGGLTLEIIEVPGHSSCSIAAYLKEDKALFASDSGGIPIGNKILTAANSNFDKYQQSLEKLSAYNINYFLPEHSAALTENDATQFIQRSIQSAKETRQILEESLQNTKDIKSTAGQISDKIMEEIFNEGYAHITRDVVYMVVEMMLNNLAKKLRNKVATA
ncbi:MAG: MBL fold metallo-hydrolase [Desulfobacterales bacterium]|nr:MBL fold metallo-hydrolase [Desulfobacterales bacterium]